MLAKIACIGKKEQSDMKIRLLQVRHNEISPDEGVY